MALAAAGRARRLPALHQRAPDLLHLRRHAQPDRPRLSDPLPAGLPSAQGQWIAFGAILFAYWLAWALYPAHEPGFFSGFLAHWNKGDNFGNAFDQWFLNLFPRTAPYVENSGGYLTLSFIPTLGTMLLGLAAGRWLRESAPAIPMRRLLAAGAIGIAAGLLLHFAGICPIVKRIWTPAWTLFSGGLCFFFLAGFCWLIEVKHYRRWAFPLVVIGMNSIAAYLMAHLWERFLLDSFRIHLGAHAFAFAGAPVEPFVRGLAVLTLYWLFTGCTGASCSSRYESYPPVVRFLNGQITIFDWTPSPGPDIL